MDHRATSPGRTRPTLTLFCGLPGSGKSTLARRLEAEGRGVRLSTDEWQADLAVRRTETEFHERLQVVLHRHALALLRHGVDVILEDGLWMRRERTATFADARSCSARIELHVFDVDYDTLRTRLQLRNDRAEPADYPMAEDDLRWAWGIFQAPSAHELNEADSYELRAGPCSGGDLSPGGGRSGCVVGRLARDDGCSRQYKTDTRVDLAARCREECWTKMEGWEPSQTQPPLPP